MPAAKKKCKAAYVDHESNNFKGFDVCYIKQWLKIKIKNNRISNKAISKDKRKSKQKLLRKKIFDADFLTFLFERAKKSKTEKIKNKLFYDKTMLPAFGEHDIWIIPVNFIYEKHVSSGHISTLVVDFIRKQMTYYDFWNFSSSKSKIDGKSPTLNKKKTVVKPKKRLTKEIPEAKKKPFEPRLTYSNAVRTSLCKQIQDKYKSYYGIPKKMPKKTKDTTTKETTLGRNRDGLQFRDHKFDRLFSFPNGCSLFFGSMMEQLLDKPQNIPKWPNVTELKRVKREITCAGEAFYDHMTSAYVKLVDVMDYVRKE